MQQSLCLTRDSLSRPWGFRLQGGFDAGFPLIVQRVFSGSPSEGRLQRGDTILSMDGRDCSRLTHREALDIIRVSGGTLNLAISKGGNNPFPMLEEQTRPTFTASRATVRQMNRPQSQFASYAAPASPVQPRMSQSVYQTSYNEVEDASLQDIGTDPDYDFMRKTVSERRQLFNAPPALSQTMPRGGRTPSQRTTSVFQSFASPNPAFGRRPEFGWSPSEEKVRQARMQSLSSTSVGKLNQSSNYGSHQENGPSANSYRAPFQAASNSRTPSQHVSSIRLQPESASPFPSSFRSPAGNAPTQYQATSVVSHVATLPRQARSYSTSQAPPPGWGMSPSYGQQNANDVFKTWDDAPEKAFARKAPPLKINVFDNEPPGGNNYGGSSRRDVHPAFPVNSSTFGRNLQSGMAQQQAHPISNVRYTPALNSTSLMTATPTQQYASRTPGTYHQVQQPQNGNLAGFSRGSVPVTPRSAGYSTMATAPAALPGTYAPGGGGGGPTIHRISKSTVAAPASTGSGLYNPQTPAFATRQANQPSQSTDYGASDF